ncbi:hypothetical protein UlMin_024624 [Ulmus minor]
MVEPKSEDWLPLGWTMKVKVRGDGRKDKYYYAPSNGPQFNSRAEVLRYLSTVGIRHHEAEQENKGAFEQSENNVVTEKFEPEGLPPGWIKEVRVGKRTRSKRRDPYYIDPISKKVFRSLKDVFQYLDELGTHKRKSEASSNKDSEVSKTSSPDVTKEHKLAIGRTKRRINFSKSSEMNKIVKDEQVLNSSCEHLPLSVEGGVSTDLRNSNLQEAKVSVPTVDEVLATKNSQEDGMQRHGCGRTEIGLHKFKDKKVPNLPRRASKRLAGLEAEPIPELKTRTRAHRVKDTQSGNEEATVDEGSSPGSSAHCASQKTDPFRIEPETKFTISKSMPVSEDLPASEKKVIGKAATVINHDKHKKSIDADEKLGVPLDLPLGELLTDPCIAFAIKTLAGETFDNSKSSEVLPGYTACDQSSGNLATELLGEGSTVVLPPGTPCIPQEHDGKVETDMKTDEKSDSLNELPFGGSWSDPCIEFAIKTLTGTIPVDYNPQVEDFFLQQLSSPKTQGNHDKSLTNVGSENCYLTDPSCQQFHKVEKPVVEQPVVSEPKFQQSKTGSTW